MTHSIFTSNRYVPALRFLCESVINYAGSSSVVYIHSFNQHEHMGPVGSEADIMAAIFDVRSSLVDQAIRRVACRVYVGDGAYSESTSTCSGNTVSSSGVEMENRQPECELMDIISDVSVEVVVENDSSSVGKSVSVEDVLGYCEVSSSSDVWCVGDSYEVLQESLSKSTLTVESMQYGSSNQEATNFSRKDAVAWQSGVLKAARKRKYRTNVTLLDSAVVDTVISPGNVKALVCILPTKELLSSEEKKVYMKLKFEKLGHKARSRMLLSIQSKLGSSTKKAFFNNPFSAISRKPNTVYLAVPRLFHGMKDRSESSGIIWNREFKDRINENNCRKIVLEGIYGSSLWCVTAVNRFMCSLSQQHRDTVYKIVRYDISYDEYKHFKDSFYPWPFSDQSEAIRLCFFPTLRSINKCNAFSDTFMNPAFKHAAKAFLMASQSRSCVVQILSSEEEDMVECLCRGRFANIQEVEEKLSHLKCVLSKYRYNRYMHAAVQHLLTKNMME